MTPSKESKIWFCQNQDIIEGTFQKHFKAFLCTDFGATGLTQIYPFIYFIYNLLSKFFLLFFIEMESRSVAQTGV